MLNVKSDVFGSLQNNCYLITDTDTGISALVDCTDYSQRMKDFIGSSKLEYILLTHGHFDHIGGVKEVKDATGAKVVISQADSPMLMSSRESLAAFCSSAQNKVCADIVVNNGDKIFIGGTELKVLATPGHTKGSVCYIARDCIFTGDTLFYCSCGRTDFPGGSADEMAESLHKLSLIKGNLKVYPGHDSISSLDFERANNPYMK